MVRITRRLFASSLGVAALVGLIPEARAQKADVPTASAPLSLDGLKRMVKNMGYEPKGEGSTFDVQLGGGHDLTVTFSMDSPGDPLTTYVYLQSYSPVEVRQLDQTALLQSNVERYSYFALSQVKKQYDLYLYRSTLSTGVTPAGLKDILDLLDKQTFETEALWNKEKWAKK